MSDAAGLRLHLLGEVEAVRGGERLALPASRKARALLVYLAATGQPQRRSRLCSIFWNVPDDPRGALRSSLYMLRAALDTPERRRLVAERDTVHFDSSDAEIDLLELRHRLAAGAEATSTAELERLSTCFRGELAEDLDLPSCPAFQAWCAAEREEVRRLQLQLRRTLIERHAAAPEAALPHARALARIDAGEASAHAALLRVLVASGRQREAEEQHDLSLRLLAVGRAGAVRELTRIWRSLAARPRWSDRLRGGTSVDPAPSPLPSPTPPAAVEAPAPRPKKAADPARRHIAVLPFTNMSDDPAQEHFADGITEDIIADLSQLSALFVIPRNTAFTYKGRAVEIVQAARRLNVAYVLQGSVRKASDRIRVNVQLIDGVTGDHLWVERFDRNLTDIFALQDDISRNVVAALKQRLLPRKTEALAAQPASQADKLYLQGRAKLSESWGTRALLRAARRLFVSAIEADPGYARAYAGIADCDAFLWVNGDLDVSDEQMLRNSSKAIELAPNLAEAHASRGVALYVAGLPAAAIGALRRAIELGPDLFEPHYFAGFGCKDIGDFQDAALHFEQAARRQPRNFQPLAMLSEIYLALGRPADSAAAGRGALRRIEDAFGPNPEMAEVVSMGAATLACLGETAQAAAWAARAIRLDPDSYTVRYDAACVYAMTGQPDAALACLDVAAAQTPRARRWLLGIARHDTQLNALRNRPDFQDFLRRLAADPAEKA